jgi:hypothetical protein
LATTDYVVDFKIYEYSYIGTLLPYSVNLTYNRLFVRSLLLPCILTLVLRASFFLLLGWTTSNIVHNQAPFGFRISRASCSVHFIS